MWRLRTVAPAAGAWHAAASASLRVSSYTPARPALARSIHASHCRCMPDDPSSNPYLQPQRSAAPQSDSARAEPLLRERPAPSTSSVDVSHLSGAELIAYQNREMDRATKRQRALNMRRRRAGRDWKERAAAKAGTRIPMPSPPPLYFPAPFASLPVIPAARETLETALIRVDKVPKSPGFSKEVTRIRGQLAKYNFVARRQLEVAEREFATKLQERIDAFPVLRKRRAPGEAETPSLDPTAAQLHPYDHSLVELSLPQGDGDQAYTRLLNHCRNLAQKLRGAARNGLQGLNNSKSMSDSRRAHMAAIVRMKELWVRGDAAGDQAKDGGSGQKSGMVLGEELRALSKRLRHIPTVEFDRNLLDVQRHVGSYLSLLPQEFLFDTPMDQLTFERLRPYLPPSPSYSFSLVGAPNVGKSSILSALSRAKVEVQNFAFTTTSLQVGHMERAEEETPSALRPEAMHFQPARKRMQQAKQRVYPAPKYTPALPLTRVQLIDTPGILFRPDSMRKPVERLTLSLCEHVQPLLLAFVLDVSGTSGNGVRVQRMLLRELRARFAYYTQPHPLASDLGPRNFAAHDPLYANVAADAELQSLSARLQRIPWLLLQSKSDLKKREYMPDEILARSTSGAEREVRLVERELREHNKAVLEEAELEGEEEDKQDGGKEEDRPATMADEAAPSDSTDLALSVPSGADLVAAPGRPRLDRAAWKMQAIREHMHRYLRRADGSFALGEGEAEGEEEGMVRDMSKKAARKLLAESNSSAAGAHEDEGSFSFSPSSAPLPTLSLSVEADEGVAELEEHIWFEVDQRESLRLERAYKEMVKRIGWIRGDAASQGQGGEWDMLEQEQEAPQLHAYSHDTQH